MAYSAVPTKATGDSAPASDWNTYVKDNFAFFATHNHDGSSGAGSAALEPNTLLFTDKADEGAPAAGKTILWTNSGKLHQITNGGSAEEFSVVGHTHAIAQKSEATDAFLSTKGALGTASGAMEDFGIGTSYLTYRVKAVTPTSTNSRLVASGFMLVSNGSGNPTPLEMTYSQMTIDSVQKYEISADLGDDGSETQSLTDVYSEDGLSVASHTWDLNAKGESSGSSSNLINSAMTVTDVELS